jgi:hypothetical protein
MTDDKFFERLRDDAASLRYEPDDVALTRLAARVRARVAEEPDVAQLLARWFRPITMSLAALALAATLGVQWYAQREQQQPVTLEAAMTGDPVEISFDGNVYTLGQ